jgi:hypothetical protein
MRELRETIRAHTQLTELDWAGVSVTGRTRHPLIGFAAVRSYDMLGPPWYPLLSADQLRQIGRIPRGPWNSPADGLS